MSEKATLLHDADQAFTELHGAIEGLSDEEMRRVWLGACGSQRSWSRAWWSGD